MKSGSYDICIVGGGVAGALVAAVAARRGKRVIVIEAGRRFEVAKRFDQLLRYQVLGTPRWPWVDDGRDLYTDSSFSEIGYDYTLNRSRVRALGGSTLRWGGMINRFWENDFRTASAYGLGVDWPISYADLEPYYSWADIELGVSGTPNKGHPPRSRDFPMDGFPRSYGDSLWDAAAGRLGHNST